MAGPCAGGVVPADVFLYVLNVVLDDVCQNLPGLHTLMKACEADIMGSTQLHLAPHISPKAPSFAWHPPRAE